MTIEDQIKQEIEAAAAVLGIAPSTLGQRVGQGGRFYARLCDGHRIWPHTAEVVRSRIADMVRAAQREET